MSDLESTPPSGWATQTSHSFRFGKYVVDLVLVVATLIALIVLPTYLFSDGSKALDGDDRMTFKTAVRQSDACRYPGQSTSGVTSLSDGHFIFKCGWTVFDIAPDVVTIAKVDGFWSVVDRR